MTKAGLKKEEAEVFVRFAEAIRFASEDLAITKGTTYDLCYCNLSSDGFDKNRHFAFLRDFEDHTVLIASNFSNREVTMKLVIPEHAFEWMEIPITEEMRPGKIIEVKVGPMDGQKVVLI